MDMSLKGAKFTWQSNPRQGFVTREKIDRVLVNWAWRSKYPHAIANALPTVSSDHAIIFLDPKPQKRSGRSFRYEAFWDEHEDCKKTVLEGWNNTDEAEGSWNVYVARSKACKRHLLTWQKKTFSAADKEIGKLKQELAFLNDQPHDTIDWGQVAGLKARINQLLKQEEMYWGMRSRIKWAKWGDRNTKFFHASTIQRRDVNRLEKLKDDSGNWLDGQDTIMKSFVKHYQDIYTRGEVQGIEDCLKDLNITVPPSLNEELCKSITDEEIKDAVECLGSLKAPGPDGLNGLFYKTHWETIKEVFCNAIRSFFITGLLPPEINETVVTLIPKIPNPDSTTHYRPISCCNFTYKVISRIMVSRLKGGLNHIITPNQSAFVGGENDPRQHHDCPGGLPQHPKEREREQGSYCYQA